MNQLRIVGLHYWPQVQTRSELLGAIEFSQRHSDNPFEALVTELYQSYKGMKRSLIKVADYLSM